MKNLDNPLRLEVKRYSRSPLEVKIGNNFYIVGKSFLGILQKTLDEIEFTRADMNPGQSFSSITHFEHESTYEVNNKLLKVKTRHYTSHGPLGDRYSLDVVYDDETVGNYRSLQSYMGGGANGLWPFINDGENKVVFHFDSGRGNEGKKGLFSICHFKDVPLTLIPNDTIPDIPNHYKFSGKEKFNFDQLRPYRKIYWELPIIDQITGAKPGILYYCTYPGFNKFEYPLSIRYEADADNLPDLEPFIGRDNNEKYLETLEFVSPGYNEQIEIVSNTFLVRNQYFRF